MKDCILVKGNKYGLTIIIDDKVSFEIIKKALKVKITEARKFFSNSKVSISFEGRVLTDNEQKDLVDIITNNSDMEVICIIENEELIPYNTHNEVDEDVSNTDLLNLNYEKALFHRGTLRSGQLLEIDNSVIIMGDVNPGAHVIAKGNVIVLGSLKGTVHAGHNNTSHPFVVALSMEPMQIKIGEIIGRSPDDNKISLNKPQIAYVDNNRICIDTLNKNIYKELSYI